MSTYPARSWRDDYEFLDTANGPVMRRKDRRSVADLVQDGEHVHIPTLLIDSAGAQRPRYPSYCIDAATPQGKAWLEWGERQREAWRSPPSTGGSHSVADHSSSPSGNTACHSLADAQRLRDEAWEERGRIQREAWRYA